MYTYEKFPNRYLQLVKQPSFRRPVKPHSAQAMFTAKPPFSKYKTRQEFECAQCIIVVLSIKSGKVKYCETPNVRSRAYTVSRAVFYYYFSSLLLFCFVYLFVVFWRGGHFILSVTVFGNKFILDTNAKGNNANCIKGNWIARKTEYW